MGLDGTLWAMGTFALCTAALALARAGRRQPAHRGWPWWTAALGAGVAALTAAAAATASAPAALPLDALAGALLLAWPVLWLGGLRRFHARQRLAGATGIDAAMLASASFVQLWLPGPAVLLLHLYVAAVAASAQRTEHTGALRLTALLVAAAALPAATSWPAGGPWVAAQALAACAALWACSLVALSAMSERTEHELRASRARMRVLAGTDPLTGLPNRRHFEAAAARVHRAPADHAPVLLLMDIDHFKQINDHLGHAAGDRALRLVGQCISQALRDGDMAVRLGGDEFALVLRETSLAQAVGVADRVVQQVQRQTAGQRLPMLTLSFGLVPWTVADSLDEALHRADRALYEAKRQGRACAVTAHGDDAEPAFSESQRLGLTAH